MKLSDIDGGTDYSRELLRDALGEAYARRALLDQVIADMEALLINYGRMDLVDAAKRGHLLAEKA